MVRHESLNGGTVVSNSPFKFRKQKRSMAEHIRRKTHNGREIVEFMLNVLRGENVKHIKTKDRLEAAKFLADRGWGRAVEQSVQLRLEAGGTTEALDELPTEDLVNVIRAMQSPSALTVDAVPSLPASVTAAEDDDAEEVTVVEKHPQAEAIEYALASVDDDKHT